LKFKVVALEIGGYLENLGDHNLVSDFWDKWVC